jgi:sterol desaturase/sphingolipid hydroxylase (fatty acid hydroxylase superfamily)
LSLPDPVQLFLPVFILAMMLEMFTMRAGARGRCDWRDTGTSLAMGLGNIMAATLTGGLVVAMGQWLWGHRLFDVPMTLWALALCMVAEDFSYYWFHRTAHRVRWFWASHVIHHSSQHYNLSTAMRQTWTGFLSLSFVFRLPLFLIGFPVEMVLFCAGANLVYQFFIHTELVRRLPGPIEYLFNTPSHHRVHHGTNPAYLDRNYGGILIIWDRLFGTFVVETEAPRYGIVRNVMTFNPLWVAAHEWLAMARDVLHARSAGAVVTALLGPPGALSGETSEAIRARVLPQTQPQTQTGTQPRTQPAE